MLIPKPTAPIIDASATVDVNLLQLYLEKSIESAEYILNTTKDNKEKEGAEETIKEAKKELKKFVPSDEDPVVTIGYLPPPKMTEIRNQRFVNSRDARGHELSKLPADFLNRSAVIARELLRWGVRGHKNISGVSYEGDTERINGIDYPVATWETVYLYERLSDGLYFHWIANTIDAFNTLDESKKKQSLPPAGTRPRSSTAKSANSSPSSRKSTDAKEKR